MIEQHSFPESHSSKKPEEKSASPKKNDEANQGKEHFDPKTKKPCGKGSEGKEDQIHTHPFLAIIKKLPPLPGRTITG